MTIETFIATAKAQGASDLHLEPGLPAALRVRGSLKTIGEPVPPRILAGLAHDIIGPEGWPRFLERRSFDLSRTLCGVRCRLNILHSSRGIGFAVRLLSSFQATIDKLNLHPDLKRLLARETGLIILSGPTGCGKSSTMAAFIQEINSSESRHIVTIENPIEYLHRPRLSYIRQREVGRDTPSVEQALIDSMREDPDVLMVGEMREPETMRLTLNAAETGHLVLTTMHSATCAEALARITSAFSPEIQGAVRGQLADCLVAVVCQRLRYRPDLKIRVPECEILMPTIPVKSFLRAGDFFKIAQVLETGAEHGMWTWQRYQTWLDNRKAWHIPDGTDAPDSEPVEPASPFLPTTSLVATAPVGGKTIAPAPATLALKEGRRIEIEPIEGGLNEVIKDLEGR